MKILRIIRIALAAIMIGLSVIDPSSHRDNSHKPKIEKRDPKDDQLDNGEMIF